MLPLAIAGTTLINAKAAAIVPNKSDNDAAEAKAFSTGNFPIIAITPPSIATAPDRTRIGAIFTPLVNMLEASISANIAITDFNAVVADCNLSGSMNDNAPNDTAIAPIAAVNARIFALLSFANAVDATSNAKQAETPAIAFKARLT